MGLVGGIIGGIIGSFCGHPFIGAALGLWLSGKVSKASQNNDREAFNMRQLQMVEELFWCFGRISKADGRVSQDEIAFCEAIISSMNIPHEHVPNLQQAFRNGRDSTDSIVECALRLGQNIDLLCTVNALTTKQNFLEAMCALAMADGVVSDAELTLLYRVEGCFGLSGVVDFILGRRTYGAGRGRQYGDSESHQRACSSFDDDLNRHYQTLGVTAQATNDEIRKAYHREIRKFHPDLFASKDITPEFRALAERKSREINGAYEALCKARKI